MNQFDDRKKAFEDKFAHDQQFQFKVIARRNKLFGFWAANKLDLAENMREEYAKSVVLADFDEPGDDDVLRKVLEDFQAADISISRDVLRHEMDRLLQDAKEQLMGEE